MGFWANLLRGETPVPSVASDGQKFVVDETAIDPAVFGLSSYAAPSAIAPRIDRRAAMQVPAVKRSRDLIATTLGGLPLDLYGPNHVKSSSNLFEQPEKNIPRSVTMTYTVEDLLFEGVAWWRIVEFGWHNYPTKVQRIAPRRVSVNEDTGRVYIDGTYVPDTDLIRFYSPNDPLLVVGARAIRTCLALDAAAQRMADGTPPLDYFTPAEGADPAEDEDVVAMLDGWQTARQSRSTAYVPAALEYHTAGWSPEQLQMADARQHAVLEIAREAGVDPEELGVSTTSRTYANQQDRRKNYLDFTLGGYRQAIEDRLSMGDVTPRGYYAKLNLSSFLRSDDKTRMETYDVGLRVGAITEDEIRELEDKPPLTAAEKKARQPAPPPAAVPQEDDVNASTSDSIQTFDADELVTFDAPIAPDVFSVDTEKRTIRGLAVPYGVVSNDGRTYQFSKGSITYTDPGRIKLLVGHNWDRAIGRATALEDTDEGLVATFKVARGAAGDEALSMAEDGVWDGLSVGVGAGMKTRLDSKTGIQHVTSAPLREISQTPCPAYDGARITSVAASAARTGKEPVMGDENETTEVEGQSGLDFSAIKDAIADGFAGLQNPQVPAREPVSAGGAFEVNEPSPYRFDGLPGEHGFIDDIREAYASGNSEARQRLETFIEEAFAVTTTNVGTLNPTQNRPDLYVPNLQFTRPLWDLVSTGSISDKTPFTVPKFSSASGLVGDHTEGVEPTPGAFSATSQTVSPAPLSGKIEINREVWDQGGSPQADGIIWGEMLNAWYEAIEAKIAARLKTTATAELNLAGAVDAPLVAAMTNYFAGLQFVRGGNRFTAFAADQKLFPALVAAKDSSGRNLLPVLGPTNAQGQVGGGFDRVALGNQNVRAAWALSVGANTMSFNFVPSSVWAWASAPKRFTFEYQVKSIDMAIWGYCGTAILRDSDVKPIDYDTSDT